MAKEEGTHTVVSDLINFLNASPTAFHAVGNNQNHLLSFLLSQFATPHSLTVSIFRRSQEAVENRRVPSNLGEGKLGTQTRPQIFLHQKPFHNRRFRYRQKVHFSSLFISTEINNVTFFILFFSILFSDLLPEMDST
jgi:hypothetical protein